ncbi:YdcF family protein [Paenibacillus sp. 1011MAR3C5]|uniref:YdcF family protein n=1 Tax=Paenibacillus sp. 1011MAR3C5 TaxID=1675787 RepID=UPI000E6C2608|nr:YdcF family protein [Paenibacillus sp. 1011MAR3C5]RJE90985.1 YdcF family protein [Paenibacillus sp. 1011MAR3C5]
MVGMGWIMAAAAMAVLTYVCWLHAVVLKPGKADALIVLGYVSKDGRIHPLLKERLDEACKLFRQYGHKYIIVSGGAVGSRRSESELMKKYLVENGVPEKRVLEEDKSYNTVQNLMFSKQLMAQYQLESFIIITNLFHIRRTKYIMHRLGMAGGFSANRSLRSIAVFQLKLTFLEIRAFRLTLPIIERAIHDQNDG